MSELDSVLKFMQMIHQLQQVKRAILVPGEDRQENDLEHHYQVAIVAWYVAQSHSLPLDVNKVIQYALVHDIVEAYAGDVDVFAKDRSAKAENERKAAERLKREFPEFTDMHTLIEKYEAKIDSESRFVYALDKVIPTMNNFLDGGKTWKQRGITFNMVKETKKGKLHHSPAVEELFNQLVSKIERQEKELFPQSPRTS